MRTKLKLLKASTVLGYVFVGLYLTITALLFSVSNNLYWLTLVLGLIALYNSLYTSYLYPLIKEGKEDIKVKNS